MTLDILPKPVDLPPAPPTFLRPEKETSTIRRLREAGVPDGVAEYNAPLVFRTLAFIGRNRDAWRQDMWASRSGDRLAHCFAGHALRLGAGETFDPERVEDEVYVMAMVVKAAAVLGFNAVQAAHVFMFVAVALETPFAARLLDGGFRLNPLTRSPTFVELCAKVREQTGFAYYPVEQFNATPITGELVNA